MEIRFFTTNPGIISELKAMDHNSKEYKRYLFKILNEIGGFFQLFKYLTESDEGNRIRKKYFTNLLLSGAALLCMFMWILITFTLTGGKDTDQFNNTDSFIFICFIFIEIITVGTVFYFALRSQRIVYQGVSYIIESYILDFTNSGSEITVNYLSANKPKKKLIIFGTLSLIILVMYLLNYGSLGKINSGQPKEFSKAGMTITLTNEFKEKDIVSTTAAYYTSKYLVSTLKEEFTLLAESGISSDSTLKEYADCIINNNSLDSVVLQKDGITYFDYSKQINGKEMIYFATVYKASDAFWVVTFACELKNYPSAQAQFIKWAKTVKIDAVNQVARV